VDSRPITAGPGPFVPARLALEQRCGQPCSPVTHRSTPELALDEPFRTALRRTLMPRAMREPPALDPRPPTGVRARHALLINPFYAKDPHASFGKHALTPTLALSSVAAATPLDWSVALFDENLLMGAAPADETPEVVGITVHLTFAKRAFALAKYYRERGAKVILGGLHVQSCPDECAPHADALAIGDGVAIWAKILDDVARGQLAPRYEAQFDSSYAADPAPRRDLLARESYLTTSSLNATRGCHNRCGFCYLATEGLRMPYRVRPPAQIAHEIKSNGAPYAVFTDNNLGSNRAYLRALCEALEPLKIIWSAAVTIDVTDDPSLVRAMAISGCTGVFVGFESLTDQNLADARKKTPLSDDYARRVHVLHAHGIQVNGSFVVGFDHDTRESFARLAQWVIDARLESTTFHILTPYPGTPLFAQLQSEGRILHRDWSLYDTAHCVFRPKNMSPEELEHGYGWLYQRVYAPDAVWARRPEDPRAVPAYLAMSLLYKKSNAVWRHLIERGWVRRAWAPLVELTRWRHERFRRELIERSTDDPFCARAEQPLPGFVRASSVVPAGV
jgi:radical SAM superfamily enzyme YgiQ (UPF0313 family)